MLSLFKILFTVVVIYLVWVGFKYRRRITEVTKNVMEERARAAEAAARKPGMPVAQDLVPCAKCGSYIAVGTRCACEKA
jgi:hypothetical protein